jgi:glycine/D-amino acid oxidase-like deaminating enzyme/nitrite reductase/ring-hydroxylating ferredoxin subunit
MQSQSIWLAAGQPAAFAPLAGGRTADVAIVGGGITGLLCAQALAQDGADVVLVESGRVGEGSTGNSTGNLYALVGERRHRIDHDHARWLARARADAIDRIENLVRTHEIDCGFVRCPWVLYSESDTAPHALERAREFMSSAELPLHDASSQAPFDVKAAIGLAGQAQFNPLRFTKGVALRIGGERCRIHESTRVTAFDADSCRLTTDRGDITAGWVIFASHSPKGRLLLHGELACHREYGVAARLPEAPLPPGIFWNAEEPFRSIRRYDFEGRTYVVVVGESHPIGRSDDTTQCYAALGEFARQRFGVDAIEYRWSAQNYQPADGLPYIGASGLGAHVLVATGFSADGLTYAAVAAPLLADLVAGRANPLLERFDPRRITASAARGVIQQSLQEFRAYAEDIPGIDASDPASVRAGEARLIDHEGEKLAVYRDPGGTLHAVSAVCTHFQCLVRWNHAERSWDCPCHGSRFDADGRVIEGPAYADLPARTL